MSGDVLPSAVLAQLDAITSKLDALAGQVAAMRSAGSGRLSSVDLAALTAALGEYASGAPGLGARVFNVRELLGNAAACEALKLAVGDLAHAGAPRRVGKLLARAEGQVLGDLHLTRAGEERVGAIWRIAKVRG